MWCVSECVSVFVCARQCCMYVLHGSVGGSGCKEDCM